MPNQVTREYIEDQLMTVAPLPPEKCGQFKIKIVSEAGKTNWLNITPEQFREIDYILAP